MSIITIYLYDIYVGIYMANGRQDGLLNIIGFTINVIDMLPYDINIIIYYL